MDWFHEIWNSLVLHITGFAPVWGAPRETAYLIRVGLNIEIIFMFDVSGIIWAKMLPPDRKIYFLGVPNRWFIAVFGSAFCVVIEYLLISANALTWDYAWWNRGAPWPIFLFGYLTFYAVSFWVFDMKTIRSKLITAGVIWTLDILALILFIPVLDWIQQNQPGSVTALKKSKTALMHDR